MQILHEVRLIDLADVALVATLLWGAIVGLRRSGASVALVGFLLLGLVYAGAQRFDLALTARLLRAFFAVFVIVVVVVFQDDLRRLVERIGVWSLRRRPLHPSAGAAETVVRTVSALAASRRGALIVLPGREPVDRHMEGGVALDARLSEPLLLSLFDPHSPGHDGAVVIRGDRVGRFSVHLPLSDDREQIGPGGTRHAAALGLAELCDALVIAVSEERGTISVARDGKLRVLAGPEELIRELRALPGSSAANGRARGPWRGLVRRAPEALVALAAAAGLWLLFVAGTDVVEVEHPTPVVVQNLPDGYELETVEPREVTVVLEGTRRRLVLADLGALRVRVDALLVQLGRRTFTLSADQVDAPPGVRVLDVDPGQVRVSVRRSAADAGSAEPDESG